VASKKPKIAILVDADNISHTWSDTIIEKASLCGEIVIRYACGTSKHLGGRWRKKIEKHKFTEKKAPDIENGADILIVKEAMDIMLKHPEIDTFCLVSNDNHFSKVPQIPRQWKKKVLIMGTEKAANLLKDDSEFILLEKKVVTKPAQQPKKTKKQKPIAEFQMLLEKAFKTVNQESIALNTLGKALKDVDSTYKPQIYGSSTLTKLLKKLPNAVEVKNSKAKLKSWKPYSPKPIAEFQILLEKAFKTVNQEPIDLKTLGEILKGIDSTYKSQIYGSSTLTKLLKKLPNITVKSGKVTIKKQRVKKKKQTPKSKKSSKKNVDSGYKEPEPVIITKLAQQPKKKKEKIDSGYKESETFTLLGKK